MAPASTFTPKASLCDSPTNLKEAIDWVLRVTGRDGKALNKDNGECICGLAAAVTDLLQSVEIEYNGYQGDVKDSATTNKGATKEEVTNHLNELFSLVQGLGGTAVVRTYIDQLAQVLSALVGWSKIVKCENGGKCKTVHSSDLNGNPHGSDGCKYLEDKDSENKCDDCGCMKWKVFKDIDWVQLGRGCTRCKGSGSEEEAKKKPCGCSTGGSDSCSAGKECKCAKEGKCCKCCCTGCRGKCNEKAKCSCIEEGKNFGHDEYHKDSYRSAYPSGTVYTRDSFVESKQVDVKPYWNDLTNSPDRNHCARILLGSVCLIWSGITYMHWTGKYEKTSPRWNNHILDGSGLDDGTLSQWLQALGFPKDMLNDKGPKNRLDQVIWDGFMGRLFLGFTHPSGSGAVDGNTAKQPYHMNYAGFVHTAHRDSFNNEARVFPNGSGSSTTGQISDTNQHKIGAIFKLYILSCAYFTGLQKKTTHSTPRNPKTIREILYWLSALPYSQAYKDMLGYAKERLAEVLKKPGDNASTTEQSELKFHQTGRWHPITVHQYNLFAHFQAVTQYCPLVLIGIQGGIHSATKGTDRTMEPAIHSLYSNTECHFTYPAVDIQAYNQVVHYIRALFYQLYFLRKQCAVKVALGGKWRECRYGNGVESKGVISWMCLGCSPMEHDRKCRVEDLKKCLVGVTSGTGKKEVLEKVKDLLEKIGEVVVQLGNAQERLDRGKSDLQGVRQALKNVFDGVNGGDPFRTVLQNVLGKLAEEKVKGLEDSGLEGVTKLKEAATKAKAALQEAKEAVGSGSGDIDPCKNAVSAAIHGFHQVLEALKDWCNKINANVCRHNIKDAIINAIDQLISICNSPKCSACDSHSKKCGKQPVSKYCDKCHQQYMDGTPSPLQAFLEDRLPGFSCKEVVDDDTDKDTVYPSAASHLDHCNGSGQCCPLPMGFRNQFYSGSTTDSTGKRLYGILYFFSNENMMQSCVYTLVRVTAALSATTPQVLGDVFGFFRGGIGEKEQGKNKNDREVPCGHTKDPSTKGENDYYCGWCASGLREEVKKIEWIPKGSDAGGQYMKTVGDALINIKGEKDATSDSPQSNNTSLSRLTKNCQYLSPLTGELYTAVSATFGGTYLSWVLYLSDALHSGLESLSDAFKQIECRGCKVCDPNKCKKGAHGDNGGGQCGCQSIVSCTGVLPVLYRHGFSYGNPFNLEGFHQRDGKTDGQYDIVKAGGTKRCHEFLDSLQDVIENQQDTSKVASQNHPLTELLKQVGQLQYDIRLPWIFVLTLAWLVAVLYLAFGAIWPLDWTHMRSHWLRGGAHQWQSMWYKVMTGRKGMELVEYFGRR
ncbi:variant erythrocyte surface antigen-1 alpha subunit [Babesia bovis T2Bo]|uniref:Variant erythrocyte surface antigen-1, putative n=1 Tax=Babesia bovis TaxID=5865 RepID=A7AXI2_BABBO|nr:variant erythrocyte surface antigen-1 alpha subunit [Babesia bovis T2Bo]KAG6440197.1 variant erythrocyte surface antigen-1 alpha subunit [Babesia bovis T2Bo]|eukprot:XP_001608623.1 variant erythrocyte surface antigen-1 [Babesia bovis T2Bo]